MADTEYWFARRFPVGHPRNAMAPINDKGFAAVRRFLAWMIGGAVAALILVLLGLSVTFLLFLAPVVFVAAAAYGGYSFIRDAQSRGDHQHTVDDYKAGRVK